MKKVVVGSKNPVKIKVAEEAFTKMFPEEQFEFVGIEVSSGVSDQPMSEAETLQGAKNRAANAHIAIPDADYFVGQEGGLEKNEDGYWLTAYLVVLRNDDVMGYARTASYLLPRALGQYIDQGIELGVAADMAFGGTNSKHKEGVVGTMTNSLVPRKEFYLTALLFALSRFKYPELF